MTLHKLWRRMAEKDYRTATKVMLLLYFSRRDSPLSCVQLFAGGRGGMCQGRFPMLCLFYKYARPAAESRRMDRLVVFYTPWHYSSG